MKTKKITGILRGLDRTRTEITVGQEIFSCTMYGFADIVSRFHTGDVIHLVLDKDNTVLSACGSKENFSA